MLASSLGAEVLIVGMVVEGIGNGTSCASVPPAVGTKVENGSNSVAVGALGKADPPTFQVPALELAAFWKCVSLHRPLPLFHSNLSEIEMMLVSVPIPELAIHAKLGPEPLCCPLVYTRLHGCQRTWELQSLSD